MEENTSIAYNVILTSVLTVLTSVVTLFLVRYVSRYRLIQLMGKLPCPPRLPIIGNAHMLSVAHTETLKIAFSLLRPFNSKGYCCVWVGDEPLFVLWRADLVETFLSSTKHINKAKEYRFLHPWLGTGLLTSGDEKWRSRRKLLTPSFHFKILEDFIDVFNEQSEIFVNQLRVEVGKGKFNIFPYITLCSLDIICDSAMGRQIHAQVNSDTTYVRSLYRIADCIHHRHTRPWMWPDFIFALSSYGREQKRCLEVLHSFTEKVIEERRVEFLKRQDRRPSDADVALGKKTRLAFLDLMLQASDDGKALSNLDIREEVDTFMFEGHDTTSVGLTFAIYLLGTHRKYQKKVHEELDVIFGDDKNRRVTSDDLKEMKYLECCIKETLRLFPSVPAIGRRMKEEEVVEGFTIPAGITVGVLPLLMHQDEKYFPNPLVFNPDRFLPENVVGRHSYAYVPFSAGPRNCIGQKFALMEQKVVLAHLLRAYDIECGDSPLDLQLAAELILRPKNGVRVTLTPR